MSKQQDLTKSLIRQGVICVGVIAVFTGLYFGTDYLVDSFSAKQKEAEQTLSHDQSEINSLKSQMDKSGVAESRFLTIQEARTGLDFSADTDALKTWLRQAKTQYRLSNSFKLSLTAEKVAENKEFAGTNYTVLEHPAMKLEFSAMSDVHVFSLLDDLMRGAPGFIRIDGVSLKRVSDIDAGVINQMRAGATPYAIDAVITFNWIGLKEKEKPKEPAPSTPTAEAK